MRFVLFYFLIMSTPLYALESVDKMNISILKSVGDNIIVLDRGLEDGINKGDHMKLTNKEGFISRGICLKSQMLSSHWKIYRVVRPELMTMDSIYKLRSLSQSEIPDDLKHFAHEDFDHLTDYKRTEPSKEVQLQQERIATFDLPDSNTDDPLLVKSKKGGVEKFVEKNFDANQFKDDTKNYRFSVHTSPMMTESRTDSQVLNWGAGFNNQGQKYLLNIQYQSRSTKLQDQYKGQEVSKRNDRMTSSFQINRVWENWSYFAMFNYETGEVGGIHYPASRREIAPFGLMYHIYEGEKVKYFDLSYAPIIESLYYDRADSKEEDNIESIRHAVRLRYFREQNSGLNLKAELWYRPRMTTNSFQMDWNNTRLEYLVNPMWKLTGNLWVEYLYQYQYDIVEKIAYGINAANTIQTLNLKYYFDI